VTVEPGQTLSHYNLIEKIGEGGMGVVWKARDEVLGRTVAIKVLPADVATDERRRSMFLDEARLASSVSDAHIAQVYELGREGGLDFIVMEYVEGEALNRVLHGRPLPPEKVAQLGRQVAHALARAHRKGLLHRDLKPSNILVTPDGEAKVVDFGLATLFERRDVTLDSMATTQTATGTDDVEQKHPGLVGTPSYMSPEQSRAETLDARSDIFSLGVVLYEMTTGQRPFSGSTSAALLKEIVRARPRPPHELSPKMPLDLERIIQKALAPTKADRYQTMDDLAVDLKRLGRDLESGSSPSFDETRDALRPSLRSWVWALSGALALALVVAGSWTWFATRGIPADPRTILVAPMTVSGQATGGEFLGRAFAETIAVNLAQSKGVSVLPVPQQSPTTGYDRDSLIKSAQSAGAGRLLTGTLTRDGSAVHATISLIDSARNRLVWGSQGDAEGVSLAPLASSMTREIVAYLGLAPSRLYESVDRMPPDSRLAASPDYIATQGASRRGDTASLLSVTQRLVTNFPDDILSHAWRHHALGQAAFYLPPSSPERRAVEAEARVLTRLDPANPWVIKWRALFEDTDGRVRESVATFTQLLSREDLAPNYRSSLMCARAQSQSRLGEFDAAFADLRKAETLDPLNPWVHAWSVGVFIRRGRYEEALAAVERWIALSPDNHEAELWLGYALYNMKRWKESTAPFQSACESAPSQLNCAFFAMALHRDGQPDRAKMVAQKALGLSMTSTGLYYLAASEVLAGERQKAFRLLRQAIDLGACNSPYDLTELATGQDFQDLRDDPEFKKLLAEVKRRLPKN